MICKRCEKHIPDLWNTYDKLHCKHCYTYLANVERRNKYECE